MTLRRITVVAAAAALLAVTAACSSDDTEGIPSAGFAHSETSSPTREPKASKLRLDSTEVQSPRPGRTSPAAARSSRARKR